MMDSTVIFFGDLALDDAQTLFSYGITQPSTLFILPAIDIKPKAEDGKVLHSTQELLTRFRAQRRIWCLSQLHAEGCT